MNKYNAKGTIKKYAFVYGMLFIPLLLFAIFYVYINFNSIVMAFQRIDSNGHRTFVGLYNFKDFFDRMKDASIDPNLRTGIINSIILYAIGLIGHPISILIAYYIYKRKFCYRTYRFLVMIPSIVSGFILCLVFKKFVECALPSVMKGIFHVTDFPMILADEKYTFGTVIFYSIWGSLSTAILLYTNAMSGIEPSITESAKIDGVNYFQELWYIDIPIIGGTISTMFITGVAGLFTSEGPLVAFWMYSAPPETWTLGYYFTSRVMQNLENQSVYPILCATGLLFSCITFPLVMGVRKLFSKIFKED